MQFIAHRVNTSAELDNIPYHCGAEVDLRDRGTSLILAHDPFVSGEDFEAYLDRYKHGTLIINIKSERIEHRALNVLQQHGIVNYFFLDCSFPMIYLLSSHGECNIALRYSEFEGLDTILKMQGKVSWVWVDCFTMLPITRESYSMLKNAGFKLCLVSPELQGRENDIESYRDFFWKENIVFDAVCSKIHNYHRWIKASAI